jgi:hypothetical protein
MGCFIVQNVSERTDTSCSVSDINLGCDRFESPPETRTSCLDVLRKLLQSFSSNSDALRKSHVHFFGHDLEFIFQYSPQYSTLRVTLTVSPNVTISAIFSDIAPLCFIKQKFVLLFRTTQLYRSCILIFV